MTKKTVKDLDMAVSQLKEELKTLKANYDTLADKYETLEKRYEVCLNSSSHLVHLKIWFFSFRHTSYLFSRLSYLSVS